MADDAVFSGLHVLDCSMRLSGAFCARLFGDFGASVILVEPPEGHPLRAEAPFLGDEPGLNRSLLHAYTNANKRSLVLGPDDATRRTALIRWADVVITTEYDAPSSEIRALKPESIQVSVTPYGLSGPRAGAPGNDLTAFALSSWAMSNGEPDRPPLCGSANQAGYLAGLSAFIAAVAAVYERDRSGLGQAIDASELEALTLLAGPSILVAGYAGAVAPRHMVDIVRGPVPCKDGWVSLTISRAQFWRDAMTVLGLDDLAGDERYSQAWFRRQQREHYSGRVEERLLQWNRWQIFEALASRRCVIGAVLDTREISENPHLLDRGFFVETEIDGKAGIKFPGAPFKMSATPWSGAGGPRPAPALGQDTEAVWGEIADQGHQRGATHSRGPRRRQTGPPLAGVRGIVLTQAWSGTFATELLALLGAEVVQIEARARPDSWRGDYNGTVPRAIKDETRRQRPWNTNGLYNAVNLNKRAITLDLGRERGRDLFRRLVPHADIIAENFSPRVMGNLGFGYADLCRLKPDIILGSLSAYGASGPYANVPGIGGTLEPMSGMSSLLGYEGGRPQNSGSMYPDPVAGSYFAAALIMALRHRDRTGQGQQIDLGMMEANASFIGDALLEYTANGCIRPRLGNHHLRIAPHNIYAAKDGRWLALSAGSDRTWQALAQHTGRAELARDPRFASMEARKANEAALDAILAAWAKDQDAAVAAATLIAMGIAAAPVLDAIEVVSDEQLRARGFFVEVDHPEAGPMLQAGVPWQFSRTPAAVVRPAPMLGEHSREVLAEYAGVTDAEYEELVTLGITGDMPPD